MNQGVYIIVSEKQARTQYCVQLMATVVHIGTLSLSIDQIHTNGYLSFGATNSATSASGELESGSTQYSGSDGQPTTLFSTSVPILGVFISDVDTTGTGNISYRLTALIIMELEHFIFKNK